VHATLAADLAYTCEVSLGRDVDAAGADNRLAEECGDVLGADLIDGSREILQYFQAEIDPVSKRYLSEDYWFCQKAQAIDLKTWFCPWMKMQHVGTYIFGGSLADLASIGASATADPSQLNKGKKKK
jgi:hypothetical protein